MLLIFNYVANCFWENLQFLLNRKQYDKQKPVKLDYSLLEHIKMLLVNYYANRFA